MAFNTAACLTAIKAKLDSAAMTTALGDNGLDATYKGAPASVGPKVSAYVTLGSQDIVAHATGGVQRRVAGFFVGFAYKVGKAAGDQAAPEDALAALLDAFITAIYTDRTLGGACKTASLDLSRANEPLYEVRAGQEFRVYPVLVLCTQDATLPSP